MFAIELYLVTYVPLIIYAKYSLIITEMITKDSFNIFSLLYLICNIIAILNFVLNIFDVNVTENFVVKDEAISSYDPE